MNVLNIVIGGVGGSGTRLIAMILASLGLDIGNDLNESFDNLTYTLFFKRRDILNVSDEEFQKILLLFEKSFLSKNYTDDEMKYIYDMTNKYKYHSMKNYFIERVNNITLEDKPKMVTDLIETYNKKIENIKNTDTILHLNGYGFKEPNSHIILERLLQNYPDMKYIHVMRNGLDMAFSENQNQVKLWGYMYLSKSDFSNIHYASLKYWCIVHKKILEIGNKMGSDKFLLINFDKMCLKPNKWLKKICKFLNVDVRCSIGLKYLVDPPSGSIGKFKKYDISIFDPLDIKFVKKLGFDTSPNLKFRPLIKTIFVHIPKTAGMALYESVFELERFFSWFLGLNKSEKDEKISTIKNLKNVTLGHLNYKTVLDSNIMSISFYKEAYKYCFVRNPYDRLVSLYKYHRVKDRLKLDFDNFVKLLYEEFKLDRVPPVGLYNVKHFSKNGPLYHYQIYGNQYNEMIKWIPPDIDFVGRFENFESDTNKLLINLGYKGSPIVIPHLNYSSSKKDDYTTYYINEQIIDYVSEIYKNDIMRFGYKLEK